MRCVTLYTNGYGIVKLSSGYGSPTISPCPPGSSHINVCVTEKRKKRNGENARISRLTNIVYLYQAQITESPPLSPHAPGEKGELVIKSQRFIRVQTCVLYKNKTQVLLSARFISGYSKRGKHTNYRNKKIFTEGHAFF